MKKILLCALLTTVFSAVSVPATALASCPDGKKACGNECISEKGTCLNLTYPELPGGFKLNDATDLPSLVAWLYTFFVMISGLAAFVMIVWGGVQWMSSQGNPTATGDARDKIKMALLGLLLVLASFLILQIINPELTLLQNPFR
ncbi:MAG: hypothetical protein HYU04_00330 [Candidatus Wildermuthbacteria bacterium]|nr:hypothetical protein [Candidatus Wildermuthbacteria bacterium]